jgi:hypothetical protein
LGAGQQRVVVANLRFEVIGVEPDRFLPSGDQPLIS